MFSVSYFFKAVHGDFFVVNCKGIAPATASLQLVGANKPPTTVTPWRDGPARVSKSDKKATISQVGCGFSFGVKDTVYLKCHHAKAWRQLGKSHIIREYT